MHCMIRLRDVIPEDLSFIHALNQAARPAVNGVAPADMDWFARHAVYFRVAENGDALAGFLIGLGPGLEYASENYRWFIARFDSFVYIDRVVVDVAHQGRGIGRLFYDDLARFARSTGTPRLICEVNTRPRNCLLYTSDAADE